MRVQGRVYKDDWAGCSCQLDLAYDQARYVCDDCGGRGTVDVGGDSDAAYNRARRTGRWKKRCAHCNGVGWHP